MTHLDLRENRLSKTPIKLRKKRGEGKTKDTNPESENQGWPSPAYDIEEEEAQTGRKKKKKETQRWGGEKSHCRKRHFGLPKKKGHNTPGNRSERTAWK